MKSIIVGTAGHIDHGKTALVKALTGIDADRLAEEKRRGITIDLGFAHMDLPGPGGEKLRLGFVDVPGHERFVRNMLAGVGGIDLVLLVIAADESIKPQTREHFDILQLIGVKRGITVLTKADTVHSETLDVVQLEVEEFLRGTFLASAPILPVSSITGAGLEELKDAILAQAGEIEPRDSQALARLPIDRVFTMKGFGTVVTGTLSSGTIRKDQELEVFPSGRQVRVRGIQVHGENSEIAIAGQRTALNLVGCTTEDLSRGMMLASPSTFSATRRLDVELTLLGSAPRPLKARSRVHLHANTMETVAAVRPHGKPEIHPGETLVARLTLPDAALLLPGDRFIIRQFSPIMTIGGGTVLDPAPVTRKATAERFLELLASGNQEEILLGRIMRQHDTGITVTTLIAETGLRRETLERMLATPILQHKVVRVGEILIDAAGMDGLKSATLASLEQFHKANPLAAGMGREQLREQRKAGTAVFEALLKSLTGEKKIEISGETVRLPGHGLVMKDEESASKRQIEEAFSSAGLKVPALQEVIAGLKIDKSRAQKIVTLLLREKVLVKLSDDLVFHRSVLETLREQVSAQKTKSPRMDVARFKEITGVSRKYAIPLLEYLDRERVTRRAGDLREIL